MAAIRTIRTISITGTGAVQRVLGPNIKRVGLIVCSSTNSLSCFRFGDAPATTSDGIQVTTQGGPVILTYDLIGPSIKAGVFLLAIGAGVISFTEILEDTLTIDEIGGS